MPQLKDFRKTKEIELPGYEGNKVIIYSGLLFGDAASENLKADEVTLSLAVLPKFIKSWNFTDEKEAPLPITLQSLELLNVKAVEFLIKEINEFAGLEKKT